MLLTYGSFMYCAYIIIALILCFSLYFLIRKRPTKVKKAVVFFVALLNFLQHIFKIQIYPQYITEHNLIHITTGYNICAVLILFSPFIILFGNDLLKNFITCIGSIAGFGVLVVPHWFIGLPAFDWEVYRAYICHTLLFISSFLPGITGLHKFELRNCWKFGLIFLGILLIILINDSTLVLTNNWPNTNPDDLYGSLKSFNHVSMMGPNNPWLENIIALFTPSFFLGNNPWNIPIPILWYAIPLYLGITVASYLGYAILHLLFHKKRNPISGISYLENTPISKFLE